MCVPYCEKMKSCTTILSVCCAYSTVCQCYKLFDRGRLAVALHCTEFQAIPPEVSMTQRASFFPRIDAPVRITSISPKLFIGNVRVQMTTEKICLLNVFHHFRFAYATSLRSSNNNNSGRFILCAK